MEEEGYAVESAAPTLGAFQICRTECFDTIVVDSVSQSESRDGLVWSLRYVAPTAKIIVLTGKQYQVPEALGKDTHAMTTHPIDLVESAHSGPGISDDLVVPALLVTAVSSVLVVVFAAALIGEANRNANLPWEEQRLPRILYLTVTP